jgi:hypothetical protein
MLYMIYMLAQARNGDAGGAAYKLPFANLKISKKSFLVTIQSS